MVLPKWNPLGSVIATSLLAAALVSGSAAYAASYTGHDLYTLAVPDGYSLEYVGWAAGGQVIGVAFNLAGGGEEHAWVWTPPG